MMAAPFIFCAEWHTKEPTDFVRGKITAKNGLLAVKTLVHKTKTSVADAMAPRGP
jgi:hypothetical protein